MQGEPGSLPSAGELLERVFAGGRWIAPRSHVQDRPAVCSALHCYSSAKNALLQMNLSAWRLAMCGLH